MSREAIETFPEDFREIISARDQQGQLVLVVGGHAANIWASYYRRKEPELEILV